MSIDATLAERGQRYGEFADHAAITQGIKDAMQEGRNWRALQDDQREALEMVAHKVGRILNGDPNYIDSWHDIIGYIRLVEQRLERDQCKPLKGNPAKTSTDPLRDALIAELKARFGNDIEVEFIGEDSGLTD